MPEVRVEEDVIVAYSPEVIQHQQQSQSSHRRSKSSAHTVKTQQPITISEEKELEDGVSDATLSPLAFEIIPPKQSHNRHRSHSRRAPPPELRKIRIKVHAEDMRYVMTTPAVQYQDLAEQIRAKFGIQGAFKLKIKDEEGDSITMGDQDDLDMAISMCRSAAAKERADMGKMEVWVQEI